MDVKVDKEKFKKIERKVCSIIIAVLLVVLAFRMIFPLCLSTKYKCENILFTSVKKLEGKELERFIQLSEDIVKTTKQNPFYKKNKKILICFHSNKLFYSIISFGASIGNAMSLGNFAVINFSETDFIKETVMGMSKVYNVRNVKDSAVHELTHVYLSKGLVVLDSIFVPVWKNEGIAECIAASSSYDIETGVNNFFADKDDKSHQFDYFKYRLAVLYLIKVKNMTYKEILESKDLNFKDVLEEIKSFNKKEVLAWY